MELTKEIIKYGRIQWGFGALFGIGMTLILWGFSLN